MPEAKYEYFQRQIAELRSQEITNITLRRHTHRLLDYMSKADLSISMGGYNTTMNILSTGVRSLMLTFMGNHDQEQEIRARALENCGILQVLTLSDLSANVLTQKILTRLATTPAPIRIDLNGVTHTSQILRQLINAKQIAKAVAA